MQEKLKESYPIAIVALYWISAMYLIGKWSVFNIDIFSYMSISDILSLGASSALKVTLFYMISLFAGFFYRPTKGNLNVNSKLDENQKFIFNIYKQSTKISIKIKILIGSLYISIIYTAIQILPNHIEKISFVYAIITLALFIIPFLIIYLYPHVTEMEFFKKRPVYFFIISLIPAFSYFVILNGAFESENIINKKGKILIYLGTINELKNASLIGHVGQFDFYYNDNVVFIVKDKELSSYNLSK